MSEQLNNVNFCFVCSFFCFHHPAITVFERFIPDIPFFCTHAAQIDLVIKRDSEENCSVLNLIQVSSCCLDLPYYHSYSPRWLLFSLPCVFRLPRCVTQRDTTHSSQRISSRGHFSPNIYLSPLVIPSSFSSRPRPVKSF